MLPKNPLERIAEVMEQNYLVTYALAEYLNHNPRLLSSDMVESFAKECDLGIDDAYQVLFCAACGFDTAENRLHRLLEREYFVRGLHALEPKEFTENPYHKTIKIKPMKLGRWELRESHYAPFEPFVCGHPQVTKEFREIPQIGYFKEQFSFPAVLENGIEWMTITPNEIETMKEPIRKANGNVLTLGLGLGYYAFMVSEKEDVTSVTVVEKDESVISLFRDIILPQFPHAEKVKIVNADAFDYLENTVKDGQFDYLFADLWHDQSDGLPLYLRLRKLEKSLPHTTFSYWIEPTILTSLRHMVFDKITDPNASIRLADISPNELLSDEFLKKLAVDIKKIE